MTDLPAWSKSSGMRTGVSDLKMLAQVEQWMAMIRDIDREERTKIVSASARLEHLLAPATD